MSLKLKYATLASTFKIALWANTADFGILETASVKYLHWLHA